MGVAVFFAMGISVALVNSADAILGHAYGYGCGAAAKQCDFGILAALETPTDVTYTTRAPVTSQDTQSMANQAEAVGPASQRATGHSPPATLRRR